MPLTWSSLDKTIFRIMYKEDPRARPIAIPPSAVAFATSISNTPIVHATPVLDVESAVPNWSPSTELRITSYPVRAPSREHESSYQMGNETVGSDSGEVELRNGSRPQEQQPQRHAFYFPKFKMPPNDKLAGIVISGIVNIGIQIILLYFFLKLVIFDGSGSMKPFKVSCFNWTDMTNNICFFSAGQISQGIISFGQVNIGIVSIGQVNVGLLFAFGQVAASMVYAPIGQLATGWYVHLAQIGFGFYKVHGAQIGFQFLKCFYPDDPDQESPSSVVMCC